MQAKRVDGHLRQDGPWVEGTLQTVVALQKAGATVDRKHLTGQGHVLRLNNGALFDWIEKTVAPASGKDR